MNREERLARELDGTGLEHRAAELAGLPVAQVDLIVMIARASRRAGREHERQVRRQRVADRRKYGHVEDDQAAAATERQTLALARRAGANLDTLARLRQHYDDGTAVLALAVVGARAQGYSDTAIGMALGHDKAFARQAVGRRFGRRNQADACSDDHYTGLAGTGGPA